MNNQPATRDTAKAVARFDITQRLVINPATMALDDL